MTSMSLLERARGGVDRAWDRLVALYQPLIYNSLRSHGLQHHAAEEMTQEVLLVVLRELEDPHSELSRRWEREHDEYVLRRLLELMEGEFEPKTLQAFRRQVLDGIAADQVAAELEMSVGAAYVAKSRVLARLRKEAEGILDESSIS